MELHDRAAIRAATTARANALKDRGYDPDRLVAYLENWPAAHRGEVVKTLAGELPGFVGAEPGSRARQLLDAARLTAAEFEAHRGGRGRKPSP
ncbi:MAG: hypothetical protein SFV24_20005 [Gemmatimonadales bacterium]|nr:hypothetical protein [Gemmatimonadales bacterium]